MSSKGEFSSNWGGVIAVCRKTRRKARSNSRPAEGGGTGNDLRWCKHHQSKNFCSVFCWRNCRYSPGGYDTVLLGRARTVGDTSGDANECCCVEAACGWNGVEEVDVSVPGFGVSISRNYWSSDTSLDLATVRVVEDPDKVGVGCGAGCEIGSTAVVHGAGDGMTLVYVPISKDCLRWAPFWFMCAAMAPLLSKCVKQWWQMRFIISCLEQCLDTSRSVYSSKSHKLHWIGARNFRGSIFNF